MNSTLRFTNPATGKPTTNAAEILLTAEIPWLYRNANAATADWRWRWSAHLVWLDQEIFRYSDPRFTKMRTALIAHKKQLQQILQPLELIPERATPVLEALRVQLPKNQSFMGYYPNALRDWGWGASENAAHFDFCRSVVPVGSQPQTIAVLGAGAGRLAYDFASAYPQASTALVDSDPLLMLLAKQFFKGDTLKLWDFPLQPLSADDAAIEVVCGGQAPVAAQFVLADALDLPFADSSLDLLILPWVLDILPVGPQELLNYFNRFIRPGGAILFFGPCGFSHRNPQLVLTPDELPQAFANAGFQTENVQQKYLPYMNSPYSSHHRSERVTALWAKKILTHTSAPPRRLPEWLENPAVAVPALVEFQQFVAKNIIYNQVVEKINGVRTLADLTRELSPVFQLDPSEMQQLLSQFLFQLFEETRYRSL